MTSVSEWEQILLWGLINCPLIPSKIEATELYRDLTLIYLTVTYILYKKYSKEVQ